MIKHYADIKRPWMCQPRLLYPERLSITIEGQSKIFYDKTKFNQYLAANPALHKIIEGKLQPKEVGHINKNTTDGLIAELASNMLK